MRGKMQMQRGVQFVKQREKNYRIESAAKSNDEALPRLGIARQDPGNLIDKR